MTNRESKPREFSRDGISGIVNPSRAMRARDVSRPTHADIEAARRAVDARHTSD